MGTFNVLLQVWNSVEGFVTLITGMSFICVCPHAAVMHLLNLIVACIQAKCMAVNLYQYTDFHDDLGDQGRRNVWYNNDNSKAVESVYALASIKHYEFHTYEDNIDI